MVAGWRLASPPNKPPKSPPPNTQLEVSVPDLMKIHFATRQGRLISVLVLITMVQTNLRSELGQSELVSYSHIQRML